MKRIQQEFGLSFLFISHDLGDSQTYVWQYRDHVQRLFCWDRIKRRYLSRSTPYLYQALIISYLPNVKSHISINAAWCYQKIYYDETVGCMICGQLPHHIKSHWKMGCWIMWKTILRRLLLMIPQVIILSILIFLIAQQCQDPFTGVDQPKPRSICNWKMHGKLLVEWSLVYSIFPLDQ